MHWSEAFIPKYSRLVYNGFWFSPEREAIQALVTETQRDVTEVVHLKLYKGNIILAGRKSPNSLPTIQRSPPWKSTLRSTTKVMRQV